MVSPRSNKRLAVFCDGTWVGRETNVANAPASNIRQLANMVGEVKYNDSKVEESTVHRITVHPHVLANASNSNLNTNGDNPSAHSVRDDDSVIAGYQEGVGLNRTFLDYVYDGATASAIGDECISVYRFIATHYTSDHEISLFGFSRGAFTARCVAGMINNCGIIKILPSYSDEEIGRLCFDVFRTYRSGLPCDAPHSPECESLKGNKQRIWQVKQPIRLMSLIDTVGALGIPRLNAGIGFDWAPFEFFDQTASSSVQIVYHAPALHDRLWIFQPCLIFAKEGGNGTVVRQKWFPGTHYDVGRMTFRFVRQSPANWIEGVVGALPDLLSRTIFPNEVLSDCVLRWLLEGVRESFGDTLVPDVDARIGGLDERIAHPSPGTTGSGDIYGNVLNYAPAGVVLGSFQRVGKYFTSFANRVLPRLGDNVQDLLGIKTIIGILTATTDRRIPGTSADVFNYTQKQIVAVNGISQPVVVSQSAEMQGVNEWGKERYASKTFENFELWKTVFGTSGSDGCAERNGHSNGDHV